MSKYIPKLKVRLSEEHIEKIVQLAASCNLSRENIIEMVNFSLEEQG